jgi:prenyl protein peptidase
MSHRTTIFLTPIIFGLAHVHHFYEFRITHPHTPLSAAIFRSVFQLGYTTLFGAYATFLYMRTGSLLAVTLVHTFCNWQGLPRFWGRLEGPETLLGPDTLGEMSKRSDEGARIAVGGGKLPIIWTIAYYVLLVIGAVSWWKSLWLLTDSRQALAKF